MCVRVQVRTGFIPRSGSRSNFDGEVVVGSWVVFSVLTKIEKQRCVCFRLKGEWLTRLEARNKHLKSLNANTATTSWSADPS